MNSEPRQDIAVIGMSVRLPEADDVARFLDNLRAGRDSVRELSPARRRGTSLPLDAEYQVSGYLEEIDTFDHAFFDISRGEANNMAPEQRLLLQVAYEAVENAGYDPDSLHGSATSVYVGDTRFDYPLLARTMEPTMVMGTHVAATAGRISRFFGLRGAAAMVDSSCSSALLAVHHGVNDLILGDADLAMVGGANLNLFGEPTASDGLDLGIRSADGKTRTFSVDADGTGSGEAVVVVLLKRLADARRDGDLVHAVIKGIAANNVAGRASTLTAPDSASQADVIERAWRKAGIDPTTVSYVEAHGTATRLGDPIEIEALDIAFGRVTSRKHCCAISSVKSNIGHTWSASGLVGLVKAVLALRHHTLFPNLHARKLSPLIDFDNSAVTVTQELTPWQPESGVRRAGVSSFGVMGTNVHAILEEAPDREPATPPATGAGWFPVSARSATAARANIAALADWLADHPDTPIADLQRTLVDGRAHRAYRHGVTASDVTELRAALAAPVEDVEPVTDVRVVLLVSGSGTPSHDQIAEFCAAHPRFDALYAECERAAAELADVDPSNPLFGQFAFSYACHGLLRHIGLPIKHVVADGAGKHVLDAAAGRVELAEAITRACRAQAAAATDLPARVDRLLARLADDQPVLFVETGPVGTISRALLDRPDATYRVLTVTDSPAAFLRDLYLAGADWTWPTTAGAGRRIELPTYRFDRIRCWLPDDNIRLPDGTTDERPDETPQDANVRDFVAAVWRDVLGVDEVAPDASFFALGGDSISGIQVINRLQVRYGIELDGFALLEHDTPTALANYVEEMAGTTATPSQAQTSATEDCPTTPAQLQVWLASQFDGGSVAFNLTRALRLTG
ncbi:MAG TPA: beta-ketoacyl synthase N-terminal-like domain-containing protein, partial [Pseudonocardiaceae bacterium]